MIFLKPEYLYLMLPPLVLFFFFIITRKEPLDEYFNEEVLKKLKFESDVLGKVGRNMMIFASLILMVIALARPVLPKKDILVKKKSIDLVVAVDFSRSMMCSDVYPNRFEFAKRRLKDFIDSFEEANIGVIGFSDDAFLISPPTYDHQSLKYLIDNLSVNFSTQKGTNFLIPLQKAKEFLKKSNRKIVIIFSDGGDKSDFTKEIKTAKESNETVYIYGIGTKKGGVIKEQNQALKDKDGNIVISKLNQDIKELALKSGGAYIRGGYGDKSVQLIAKDIKEKFKMHEVEEKSKKDYKELFYYPLAVAVLFMLFAFSSLPRRYNNIVVIFILFAAIGTKKADAKIFDFLDIQKGESAYKQEDYKKSIKYFQDVASSKKDAESFYDLANAYYKSGNYKGALKIYKSLHTVSENLNYKRWFNAANALFKLKRYEDALKAYENAKRIKSESDLLYNIELTKKMLKRKKSSKKNEQNSTKKRKKQDKNKKNKEKKKSQKGSKNDASSQKKRDTNSKSNKQKQKNRQKLSKKEMKMWMEHLQSLKPKIVPMKLGTKDIKKRSNDEKPW